MLNEGIKDLINLMCMEETINEKPIKNINTKIEKNKLIIQVDLKNFEKEKTISGKSDLIASTRAGLPIKHGDDIIMLQLNIFNQKRSIKNV